MGKVSTDSPLQVVMALVSTGAIYDDDKYLQVMVCEQDKKI